MGKGVICKRERGNEWVKEAVIVLLSHVQWNTIVEFWCFSSRMPKARFGSFPGVNWAVL